MSPKASLFVIGLLVTTVGMTLVLQQWGAIVLVFKAFIGPALAVLGLVILFASSLNQHEDGTR